MMSRHKVRRIVSTLHSWVGALAMVFLLCVSVTGAIIPFSAKLIHLETGALPNIPYSDTVPDVHVLKEKARTSAGPDFIPYGYLGPDAEIATPVAMIWGLSAPFEDGGETQIVTFDPATGNALGQIYLDRTVTHEVIEFHANLLAGPVGAVIVAAMGLLMSALAMAGLYLWWPRRNISKKVTQTPRATVWSWHSVIGFWLAVPVLAWGLSGTYWSQPDWAAPLIAQNLELDAEIADNLGRACDVPQDFASLQARASEAAGGGHLREVNFAAPWQNWHSFSFERSDRLSGRDGSVTVFASAVCAKTPLHTVSAPRSAAFGAWLIDLHAGEVFGPFRRPVTVIVGLALALLSITGLWIWFRQNFRRRAT